MDKPNTEQGTFVSKQPTYYDEELYVESLKFLYELALLNKDIATAFAVLEKLKDISKVDL